MVDFPANFSAWIFADDPRLNANYSRNPSRKSKIP